MHTRGGEMGGGAQEAGCGWTGAKSTQMEGQEAWGRRQGVDRAGNGGSGHNRAEGQTGW